MTVHPQTTGAINHNAVIGDMSPEEKGFAALDILAALS